MDRKTWEEFRNIGLLWWVNRGLHLFGWAIVLEFDSDNKVIGAYPARVQWRGFEEQIEVDGFRQLTDYLEEQGKTLRKEAWTE